MLQTRAEVPPTSKFESVPISYQGPEHQDKRSGPSRFDDLMRFMAAHLTHNDTSILLTWKRVPTASCSPRRVSGHMYRAATALDRVPRRMLRSLVLPCPGGLDCPYTGKAVLRGLLSELASIAVLANDPRDAARFPSCTESLPRQATLSSST